MCFNGWKKTQRLYAIQTFDIAIRYIHTLFHAHAIAIISGNTDIVLKIMPLGSVISVMFCDNSKL